MSWGEGLSNAYEAASETMRAGYDTLAQATADAYTASKQAAIDAVGYVGKKLKAGKQKVENFVGAKPAGAPIGFCTNLNKAQRVAKRKQKIAASKQQLQTLPPGEERDTLAHATERLDFNNYAVERARLADSTYSVGQAPPPEGWQRPSKEDIEKLGLNPADFPQFKTGFKASEHTDGYFVELYKTDPGVFGEEKYVLAYRGTQGGGDWATNAKQAVGKDTEHYIEAMSLARKAKKKLGDQLEVTGHSLGGGMATAAGIVSGTKTFAFNPAGVHPATLERVGDFSRDHAFNSVGGKPLVDNVVVPGEILTSVQHPTVQRATLAGITYVSPVAGAGVAGAGGRAMVEQGTVSYGMAGPRHDVPLLGNAKEVAEATAQGKSIQGMTPTLAGKANAAVNPVKKVEMHAMHSVIAGMEQQKADDLALIEQRVKP